MRRSVLLAIGLGAFLAQLDGTIMNVTLPALSRSFKQTGLHSVQPVITAYLAATVALLPVLGKIADRLGRKRLFLCGFALFGAASVLCALTSSIRVLVTLRIAQAIGGALLSGTSLALVAANSGTRRGHALGRLSIVFALSGLLGPPIGGGLVQAFGWQSVFWLNVPLSVLGFTIAARNLPADPRIQPRGQPDLAGLALFAAATACLAAGIGNLDLPSIDRYTVSGLPLVVAGAIAFVAFFRWETRLRPPDRDPLLDVRLLRNRDYGLGILAAFLNNGVTIMMFVLVPFWLSRGWHVSNGALGAIFLPVAFAVGGFSPFAGKRSDRRGPRLLTTLGALTGAASALVLAWQATYLLWPVILIAMSGLGACIGLFAAPNNNAVLGSVPESALASAGSLLSAARTLGVIVGVSAGSAAFDTLSASHGPNGAARILFVLAACVSLGNAALCWTTRTMQSGGKADLARSTAIAEHQHRHGR